MTKDTTSQPNGRIKTVVLRCKPYIQPFERVLAAAELRGLIGEQNKVLLTDSAPDVMRLDGVNIDLLKHRLTYWETIEVDGNVLIPDQIHLELSDETTPQMQFALEEMDASSFPKRRKLRYGVHDLHEYRGKFFPQLVRSLINAIGLPAGESSLTRCAEAEQQMSKRGRSA